MINRHPTPSFRPFMMFIDGGYLRSEIKEKFGHDKIDFNALPLTLAGKVSPGLDTKAWRV